MTGVQQRIFGGLLNHFTDVSRSFAIRADGCVLYYGNMRAGNLPDPDARSVRYLKLPLDLL